VTVNLSDPPDRRATFFLAGLVFAAALAVRLVYFFQVRDNPLYQFITLDERGNHEFALAILHGQVPAVSYYKAPLYCYFLAGVYAILGPESIRARLVQCILVSLSPVLTALIARRLFGWTVALIAGLWAAAFWTFVYYSTELLDAGLACFWYLLLAYGLVAWDDRRWSKWFFCGAILGLGAITRPNILPFAPVLAVMVLIVAWRRRVGGVSDPERVSGLGSRVLESFAGPGGDGSPDSRSEVDIPITPGLSGSAECQPSPERRTPNLESRLQYSPETPDPRPQTRQWRRALINVVALTVGCCLTVLPVTLRNRIVGGEWVLLGAYGGLNIHVANNPHSDSKNGPLLVDESRFLPNTTWDPNEPWARCCLNYKNAYRLTEAHLGRRPTPGEFSSHLSRLGFEYIRENPGWFASHALRRFCWLFNAYEFPSNKDLYHFSRFSKLLTALSCFHYGWLAPLALVGAGLALSRPALRTAPLVYLIAMWASLALPAIVYIVNARFRVPMVSLMVPFAAYALVELVRMVRDRREWRRLGVAGCSLVALSLFSNLNLFGYRQAHEPYLRFAYLVACTMSGRDDLVDAAVADFEHDLAIDMENYRRTGQRSNTTLLLDHCTPMRLLFPYYVRHGRKDKALEAAKQMLDHEGVDGPTAVMLFDFFVSNGEKAPAAKSLQVIEQQLQHTQPSVVLQCLMRFAQTWKDLDALERARRILKDLLRAYPTRIELHRDLEAVTRLLGPATSTRSSSQH
jgi:hypothetical protein